MTGPLALPDVLPGRSYKLRWPEGDHALYITLNDIVQEGAGKEPRRRPSENFFNSQNMEPYAWTPALTRTISAVLRRGGSGTFVAAAVQAAYDRPRGAWLEGRQLPPPRAARVG